MKNKKQHWIPQSYLQEWCDPDVPEGQSKYVWIFSIDGMMFKRKDPKNVFYETDMYTIHLPDGSRDLKIENGLAGLEGLFVQMRQNVIAKRHELSVSDRLIVLAMIAAFFSRTRQNRDHLKDQWGRVLELMEYMKKEIEGATPEQLEALSSIGPISSESPKLDMNDVKKLAKEPLQNTLLSSISTQTELLFPMNLTFLCTKNDPGFITSDAPCVWFDPEAYKRPAMYRSPGLIYPSIEITLPISPNQLALLTWSKLNTYIDVPDRTVDELNRRTRFYAEEYFVVKRNITKPIWFEYRQPPV